MESDRLISDLYKRIPTNVSTLTGRKKLTYNDRHAAAALTLSLRPKSTALTRTVITGTARGGARSPARPLCGRAPGCGGVSRMVSRNRPRAGRGTTGETNARKQTPITVKTLTKVPNRERNVGGEPRRDGDRLATERPRGRSAYPFSVIANAMYRIGILR